MDVHKLALKLRVVELVNDGLSLIPGDEASVLMCPIVRGRANSRHRFGSAVTQRRGNSMRCVRITIHPALLDEPALEAKLVTTFLHEVAHLIAEKLFFAQPFLLTRGARSAGHGPVWKRVMRTMNQPAIRCSSSEDALLLAAHAAPVALKLIAKCDRCGFEWMRQRGLTGHKHRIASEGFLKHRKCGGSLFPEC